jgi:tRNA dimethylallyltransferase
MHWSDLPNPLVVLVGPTAVGKTEIALQLAETFDGEIISADSRQFYRGMDIGTAKPTMEERSRVQHHLIDVANPDRSWSLAVYKQAAQEAIRNVHNRKKLPFLVGGTGQYVYGLIENWDIPSQQPDTRFRCVLEQWAGEIGIQGLHDRLAVIDPQAAAAIDARNVRRTIRALEVIFLTGRKFSTQRRKGEGRYTLMKIGLQRPRTELYARIDARIDAMMQAGLVDEVASLLQAGYPNDLPTFSAIGYREVIAYLDGKIALQDAIILMKRATRQYVRRQANWFKQSDPDIAWFDVGPDTLSQIVQLIETGEGFKTPLHLRL